MSTTNNNNNTPTEIPESLGEISKRPSVFVRLRNVPSEYRRPTYSQSETHVLHSRLAPSNKNVRSRLNTGTHKSSAESGLELKKFQGAVSLKEDGRTVVVDAPLKCSYASISNQQHFFEFDGSFSAMSHSEAKEMMPLYKSKEIKEVPDPITDEILFEKAVKPVLDAVTQLHIPGSLLVYGMTSSGKTRSCFGEEVIDIHSVQKKASIGPRATRSLTSPQKTSTTFLSGGSQHNNNKHQLPVAASAASSSSTSLLAATASPSEVTTANPGMIALACSSLLESFPLGVYVSMFEVYNEKLRCLFSGGDVSQVLTPSDTMHFRGLRRVVVKSNQELRHLINQGMTLRRVAATGRNDHSSRSHAVLQMFPILKMSEDPSSVSVSSTITTNNNSNNNKENTLLIPVDHNNNNKKNSSSSSSSSSQKKTTSSFTPIPLISQKVRFTVVDLAGSERLGAADPSQHRESANINLALSNLGRVIQSLAQQRSMVKTGNCDPECRASALTWALRDELQFRTAVSFLVTISPMTAHASETLSSLRFAGMLKAVRTVIKVQPAGSHLELRAATEVLAKNLDAQRNSAAAQQHQAALLLSQQKQISSPKQPQQHQVAETTIGKTNTSSTTNEKNSAATTPTTTHQQQVKQPVLEKYKKQQALKKQHKTTGTSTTTIRQEEAETQCSTALSLTQSSQWSPQPFSKRIAASISQQDQEQEQEEEETNVGDNDEMNQIQEVQDERAIFAVAVRASELYNPYFDSSSSPPRHHQRSSLSRSRSRSRSAAVINNNNDDNDKNNNVLKEKSQYRSPTPNFTQVQKVAATATPNTTCLVSCEEISSQGREEGKQEEEEENKINNKENSLEQQEEQEQEEKVVEEQTKIEKEQQQEEEAITFVLPPAQDLAVIASANLDYNNDVEEIKSKILWYSKQFCQKENDSEKNEETEDEEDEMDQIKIVSFGDQSCDSFLDGPMLDLNNCDLFVIGTAEIIGAWWGCVKDKNNNNDENENENNKDSWKDLSVYCAVLPDSNQTKYSTNSCFVLSRGGALSDVVIAEEQQQQQQQQNEMSSSSSCKKQKKENENSSSSSFSSSPSPSPIRVSHHFSWWGQFWTYDPIDRQQNLSNNINERNFEARVTRALQLEPVIVVDQDHLAFALQHGDGLDLVLGNQLQFRLNLIQSTLNPARPASSNNNNNFVAPLSATLMTETIINAEEARKRYQEQQQQEQQQNSGSSTNNNFVTTINEENYVESPEYVESYTPSPENLQQQQEEEKEEEENQEQQQQKEKSLSSKREQSNKSSSSVQDSLASRCVSSEPPATEPSPSRHRSSNKKISSYSTSTSTSSSMSHTNNYNNNNNNNNKSNSASVEPRRPNNNNNSSSSVSFERTSEEEVEIFHASQQQNFFNNNNNNSQQQQLRSLSETRKTPKDETLEAARLGHQRSQSATVIIQSNSVTPPLSNHVSCAPSTAATSAATSNRASVEANFGSGTYYYQDQMMKIGVTGEEEDFAQIEKESLHKLAALQQSFEEKNCTPTITTTTENVIRQFDDEEEKIEQEIEIEEEDEEEPHPVAPIPAEEFLKTATKSSSSNRHEAVEKSLLLVRGRSTSSSSAQQQQQEINNNNTIGNVTSLWRNFTTDKKIQQQQQHQKSKSGSSSSHRSQSVQSNASIKVIPASSGLFGNSDMTSSAAVFDFVENNNNTTTEKTTTTTTIRAKSYRTSVSQSKSRSSSPQVDSNFVIAATAAATTTATSPEPKETKKKSPSPEQQQEELKKQVVSLKNSSSSSSSQKQKQQTEKEEGEKERSASSQRSDQNVPVKSAGLAGINLLLQQPMKTGNHHNKNSSPPTTPITYFKRFSARMKSIVLDNIAPTTRALEHHKVHLAVTDNHDDASHIHNNNPTASSSSSTTQPKKKLSTPSSVSLNFLEKTKTSLQKLGSDSNSLKQNSSSAAAVNGSSKTKNSNNNVQMNSKKDSLLAPPRPQLPPSPNTQHLMKQ